MYLKSIAIICARGGSKGLKKKNLQKLNGETLLRRVIRHALESNSIDTILVSTDDLEIAKEAKKSGAEVPFLRPPEISGDLATTEETLKHALLTYEQLNDVKFDIAVFLTATDIFREPRWISQAVNKLKNNPEIESVFVGHKTHKNFWEMQNDSSWERVKPWMSEYSSRQIRRYIIREDTGLACASRAHLWRVGKRIGDKVDIIVNDDDFTSIDIHNQEDLDLANAALKIRSKNKIWKFLEIEDFFDKEDFDFLLSQYSKINLDQISDNDIHISGNYIFPDGKMETSVIDSENLLYIHNKYTPKLLELLKQISPGKVKYHNLTKIGLVVQGKDYEHHIHEDDYRKLLSVVVYIDPKNNSGTFLYSDKKGRNKKTVEWQQNKAFIFSRVEGQTWHSFKSDGKNKRFTVIYTLLVDDDKRKYRKEIILAEGNFSMKFIIKEFYLFFLGKVLTILKYIGLKEKAKRILKR